MKKLVIVPAYNEEKNISATLHQIIQYTDWDICVINDCSSDRTSGLAHIDHKITVIDLPFNLGIGGAVQTGYIYASEHGYDIAIQVDADGQHNPHFLNDLAQPIEENVADLVIGSRFIKCEGFQSSAMRRIGINYFSRLIRMLTGRTILDTTSGFRACNSEIISLFAKEYPNDYPEPETNGKLLRLGFRIMEIPVVMRERAGGVSSISTIKSGWYMIKVTLALLIDWLRKN